MILCKCNSTNSNNQSNNCSGLRNIPCVFVLVALVLDQASLSRSGLVGCGANRRGELSCGAILSAVAYGGRPSAACDVSPSAAAYGVSPSVAVDVPR